MINSKLLRRYNRNFDDDDDYDIQNKREMYILHLALMIQMLRVTAFMTHREAHGTFPVHFLYMRIVYSTKLSI